MPDPKKYDSQDDWMGACVPKRIDEGDKRDQAVAVCLSMWRKKEMESEVKDKLWDAVTSWESLMSLFKEKPMKTVGGTKYPSSDFLVVEDSQSPSTWHLQVKKHGTPDHNLMGAAKAALTSAGGHRGNPYQGPGKVQAIAKLKRLYASEDMEWTKEIGNPFMVWKDTETDEWRWLAIYSNKWRDQDNPPEILASEAHKDFVKAVDAGDWPYPEAWLWHVPGTRFGVADFVAYDDVGFALASGTVDKGQESVAAFLAEQEDLSMSHGMPTKEIRRDDEDPTIITRYRSIEISPLPREAAANKHGTAIELFREVKMAIPDNKRAFLADAYGGEEGVQALEAKLADKAKELEEMDIESKEESLEEAEQEQVEPVETEEVEESEPKEESEDKEEAAPETPNYVTADEVAEAVGAYLKPLADLVERFEAMETAIEEQAKEIKALQKDDEEKLKETLADTPAASLFERIGSVIGSDETYVDGRTKLAKSGPSETNDDRHGPTPVGVLNEMIARSWANQQ